MKTQTKIMTIFSLFFTFAIIACGSGGWGPIPAPVIATVSTIAYGDDGATITVTGTNFREYIVEGDLNVDVGTTGLTPSTVNYVSATEITVVFTGTAAPGSITIQAKASAFDPEGSSASNTLTIPVLLEIGDSYGGGVVAYILVDGDPGYDANVQHGLIAATTDQGRTVWHNYNADATGATATALGTGNANTNTILAIYGTESNAAKLCADYSVTVGPVTYDDWYLPSWEELNTLYAMSVLGFGGFVGFNYWASSEWSESSAYAQSFGDGGLWLQGKNALNYVRAVRSF